MSSSRILSSTLLSAAAALPLMISIRDSFYSLCQVQGSSMEPSLKHGDILLIRKADFPVLRRLGIGGNNSGPNNKSTMAQDIWDVGKNNNNEDEDDDNVEDRIANLVMRSRRLREYEYQDHIERESASIWFRSPPWPIKGQIVTYRSPYQYPTELCIKRVVGVAGQVVETTTGLRDVDINSIWVEGDNHERSSDSRNHGAVNQKLVAGVAEYVLWPPSRMGKLRHDMDEKRSYWP